MNDEVKRREEEEPRWIDSQCGSGGYWTVPLGYKHPSCPGCGHKYWEMRPQKSVGGASVSGDLCRWCVDELRHVGDMSHE